MAEPEGAEEDLSGPVGEAPTSEEDPLSPVPRPGPSNPTGPSGPPWASLNGIVIGLIVILGLRLGLGPLSDNSFFTHLSTGRLILADRTVPTVDPYSFTAAGEPWTVQSWFASVVYAAAEDIGGFRAIRVVVAALMVGILLSVWRLTKPAEGLIVRLALVAFVFGVGAIYWSERPLLFGVLGLTLVLRAAQDDLDPRWLIPIMWVWANSHGSFPFAPAVLVLLALGRRLDGESPTIELRALGWTILGLLAAALNPLGLRLLVFPVTMLERREAFSYIAEWSPMGLTTPAEVIFAVQVLVAIAAVALRRWSWRSALPLGVFVAAALMSRRNIVQASVVVSFISVAALGGLGRIDGTERRPVLRPVAAAIALLAAVVAWTGLTGPNVRLDRYPVAALEEAESSGFLGAESRLMTTDVVGGYAHARFGPDGVKVFADDRVDMYPLPVIRDLVTLSRDPTPSEVAEVVGRHDPTVIVWKADSDVARWISTQAGWEVPIEADGWVVAVPTQ